MIYPWQQPAWRQLQQLRERLPHAILLHGPQGIGKTVLAEYFARTLLCEAPTVEEQACGRCASCVWLAQGSHPDYRRVRPEILDEASEVDGDDAAGSETDGDKKSAKSTRAPSKEIKIDQIRALSDFMNVATHRQGLRVVLLYPAEALNAAAANALLKTLEEPPPQTVFLLIAHSVDRLLPTILSRCRQFPLSMPPRAVALDWLNEQKINDAESWLAQQGGAPLAAYEFAQSDLHDSLQEFLRCLAQPSIDNALKSAERLHKNTPLALLLEWLQRWQYDLLACRLIGQIRYYPQRHKELNALAARVSIDSLLRVAKSTNQRRAIVDHPLSARLVIEEMLLDYAALFSAQRSNKG